MRFLLFVFCFWSGIATAQREKADLVLRNGRIYTFDVSGRPRVKALAVRGERIVFAGSNRKVRKWTGPGTRVIDLKGRTVLPGLTDAHVHPIGGGLALLECDLTDVLHADSILARLARFTQNHPEKTWIRGENMWLAAFPGGNPDKRLLDRIAADRPMFVSSADGHSAWVNSKALELAGITAQTPDPEHGRIERDSLTGEASGTLREDAIELVARLIPPYSDAERLTALRTAVQMANALGITNLTEASAGKELSDAYLTLDAAGTLNAHVNVSLYADVSKGASGARTVLALHEILKQRGRDVHFGQVKLFMDGVVEGKTAAMLEPYQHESHTGIANAHPDSAIAMILALDKAGMQVHVHAIGDRGVRMTLDAFEQARRTNGVRDARHHIAHLQVVHPDDIPRFKKLDVTANFQALWATLEDTYMTDLNFPFLGAERSEWQYPIGTLVRSGARLALGSDWPVSTMNPFMAAQVAVTRRGPDHVVRPPWTPQHLTDIRTVMEAYTRGGAWLSFREQDCGALAAGKLADLIVLDRNVLSISRFDVHATQVDLTLFKGRVVWDRAANK